MYCTQWIRLNELGTKETIHSVRNKNTWIKPSERVEADDVNDRMLVPLQTVKPQEVSVAEICNLFVDDIFGTVGTEIEQRVLARLRKDFQVGSEDWEWCDTYKAINSLDKRFTIRIVHRGKPT